MKVISNNMSSYDFEQPDFLLAEIPIKNNTVNDDRIWVYCSKTFSLIEFILQDDFLERTYVGTQASFIYKDIDGYKENWIGVYVQNNCAMVGIDQKQNLVEAWKFLEEYFKWEETEEEI
ncbi:hypothetical protein [Flavobacterium sp. NKUCC04_CG]|uniref:hypothetical protein n=1 Tax=Flavobacterium sp. NKUCC04_CG TaxID=2842121 RepID=UPI001C5A727F|nr:hypothetical protein [Flavobacterium sp. NKUCC04_CG]MBW3519116.1 hypothetical protein [Flavobacterium sp. NKUCC04_CG]